MLNAKISFYLRNMSFLRKLSQFAMLFLILCGVSAQEKRAALVIGNGAYTNVPRLNNPVNDVKDVVVALKVLGFEVIEGEDLDLAGMEESLQAFNKILEGKDVALFYYSGHGVQVQGENFLIPVRERIESEITVRSRAMPLSQVLNTIRDANVSTALIFLDACRDNPFPGASRSGVRGLSIVSSPKEIETLISYATEPGETASDGTGRNGIFTAAFLKNLSEPGLEISELMRRVRADVIEATNGNQRPRTDIGLSKPFYFADPELLAQRAKEASDKAAAELSSIEEQIAALQAQINSTKDEETRQRLLLDQQRQQAIEAAKKLEAAQLAEQAQRQAEIAAQTKALEEKRKKDLASAQDLQNALAQLAAEKRAELDKLAANALSESPDVLVDTVERLEKAIGEVESEYANVLEISAGSLTQTWQAKLDSLSSFQPDPWESDAMFAARIDNERKELIVAKDADIAKLKAEIQDQKDKQIASWRQQLQDSLKIFDEKSWIVSGSLVSIDVGQYERNAMFWPFIVNSKDPSLPISGLKLKADLSKSQHIKADYLKIDTAIKTNALTAELRWGIDRQNGQNRCFIVLRNARIIDLNTGSVIADQEYVDRLAWFEPGKRNELRTSGFLQIIAESGDNAPELWLDGRKLPSGTSKIELQSGSHVFEYQRSGESANRITIQIAPGEMITVDTVRRLLPLVFVEGGTFTMGSMTGKEDERPIHKVTITSFWIGKYEVTQGQYRDIMVSGAMKSQGQVLSDDHPVVYVSWYDAIKFCNKLSAKEQLEPVYEIASNGEVRADFSKNGYRLPTEAEWEYAARGGQKSNSYPYSGSSGLDWVGWYNLNSGYHAHPVGSKDANELGIYDMSGNVYEWCWDYYGLYSSESQRDPTGNSNGNSRVNRGGGWGSKPDFCSISSRSSDISTTSNMALGFRVARRQ